MEGDYYRAIAKHGAVFDADFLFLVDIFQLSRSFCSEQRESEAAGHIDVLPIVYFQSNTIMDELRKMFASQFGSMLCYNGLFKKSSTGVVGNCLDFFWKISRGDSLDELDVTVYTKTGGARDVGTS
uniref:Uncharacterized protein n=1 Tax=Onchocerca volvulus TaxID=6282 RepID=A0A2K6VMI2_ONCVO